jgi:SAM-dependent methyltransferase
MKATADDNWAAGDAYEGYMGRWSRPLARAFITWLQPAKEATWLEVGCGTGALTQAICDLAVPTAVMACDPSESFVGHARRSLGDSRVSFIVADVDGLPNASGLFDYVVSGLVLNFVSHPLGAVARMKARLRKGGMVGAYVWDYGEGMEFLRYFWDEATALDANAASLDEGHRFPICRPDSLRAIFAEAGLTQVAVEALEVPTNFSSFEAFWTPFLQGTGPAPSYLLSLSSERRGVLRQKLVDRLTPRGNASIRLTARAWSVSGVSK